MSFAASQFHCTTAHLAPLQAMRPTAVRHIDSPYTSSSSWSPQVSLQPGVHHDSNSTPYSALYKARLNCYHSAMDGFDTDLSVRDCCSHSLSSHLLAATPLQNTSLSSRPAASLTLRLVNNLKTTPLFYCPEMN